LDLYGSKEVPLNVEDAYSIIAYDYNFTCYIQRRSDAAGATTTTDQFSVSWENLTTMPLDMLCRALAISLQSISFWHLNL
jgi:hypothetical protein